VKFIIKILHVNKYYNSVQNMKIMLAYKIFKISHIIFQLNKQNKVYLNASLYYTFRNAKLLVL